MVIASLLIIVMDKPVWRASCITTIAMMIVILLIDGTAHTRIVDYKQQLETVTQAPSSTGFLATMWPETSR